VLDKEVDGSELRVLVRELGDAVVVHGFTTHPIADAPVSPRRYVTTPPSHTTKIEPLALNSTAVRGSAAQLRTAYLHEAPCEAKGSESSD
jgi:hypothetical protein